MLKNIELFEIFDFHCHIDLHKNYPYCLNDLKNKNLFILAVTTTPLAWNMNYTQSLYYDFIIPSLGMHPQLVGERAKDFIYFENYINKTSFIGEIGIDNSKLHSNSIKTQIEVFESILKLCSLNKKILSIHSYSAVELVLKLVFKYKKNFIPILHWFTGSIKEAALAVNLGCYFSFNLSMLKTIKGKNLIKFLPKEVVLTESDFPFTKESYLNSIDKNIENCIFEISNIWGTDIINTRKILKNNSIKLLSKIPQ